jgi:hypothetical protein
VITTWVEWVEPFVDGEPVYCKVTKETAIKFMQVAHPNIDPERALDEFVVVNWATIREEEIDPKHSEVQNG